MGKWVFEELRGAAVRREPNEAVLFKTEQTAEGEYAGNDALVREILQNALDARSRDNEADGPVRVRLAIHEADEAPSVGDLAYYFERLKEPLRPRQIDFEHSGTPKLPCRFLVCEDFGTRGLEGGIDLFQDPPLGNRSDQDFYWFWRNIGRSAKTGDDLGRWGLGKTVYRAVSRLGCMFGVSIRKSDRQRMLMGQAVLHIHRIDNKEYMPEGYWCGLQNAKGLPMPIEAPDEISRFCREWHLTRQDQPGLSVVAPFVPEELQAKRLLQAVAVHFFTRILRGELIVVVAGRDVAGRDVHSITLDKKGISEACKLIKWDGPKRTKRHTSPPIDFAKHCLSIKDLQPTQPLGKEKVPELSESAFGTDQLTALRQRFASGQITCVRVHLWLPRRQGPPQAGNLDVFVQRQLAEDATRSDSYYVREGMTITKITSRASLRGVHSIVNVDPGPLAKLLGDTEGPAHEDWDTSAERPDREWKTWKGRVKFVRGIVDSLVDVLTPSTTEPDFDLLSDFFSIDRAGGNQRQRRPGRDGNQPTALEAFIAEPKWFRIVERTGGFTVCRTPNVPMPDKPILKVSVAYDLPSGDPLRNWSQIDFKIGHEKGSLPLVGNGFTARRLRDNVFFLTQITDSFRLSVDGFDLHRDLYVRVDDVSNSEDVS